MGRLFIQDLWIAEFTRGSASYGGFYPQLIAPGGLVPILDSRRRAGLGSRSRAPAPKRLLPLSRIRAVQGRVGPSVATDESMHTYCPYPARQLLL